MIEDWQPVVTSGRPWWDFWSPARLMMRRRENGRWVYREPTKDEKLEHAEDEAW